MSLILTVFIDRYRDKSLILTTFIDWYSDKSLILTVFIDRYSDKSLILTVFIERYNDKVTKKVTEFNKTKPQSEAWVMIKFRFAINHFQVNRKNSVVCNLILIFEIFSDN